MNKREVIGLEYLYKVLIAIAFVFVALIVWTILSYNRLWTLKFKIDRRSITINEAVRETAQLLIDLIKEFMRLSPTSFEESRALQLAEEAKEMSENIHNSDEATDAADKLKDALDSFERAIDPEPYELRINTKLRAQLTRVRNCDTELFEQKVGLNMVIKTYNRKVFSPLHKLTCKIFRFKMKSIYFVGENYR